jgi:anti-sigma B factor antagonist
MVAPRTELSIRETGGDGGTDTGAVVLSVVGELDIGTSDQLRTAVGRYLRPQIRLILDLAGVTFCDSTGLAALVGVYKQVAAQQGDLLLRAPVPRVRNLLAVTGLDRVLRVEEP